MAQWIGICGVRLSPLAEALKEFVLGHDVIHADETPVKLLAPGKGKTAKAYVWVYRTTNFAARRAVFYDFSTGRGGDNARRVLQGFGGTLVSDDFSGYHALQGQGVTAALCMAHARRKLFEAHQFNGSPIAAQALRLIAKLYEIEREARELQPEARRLWRRQHAKPVAEALQTWLSEQRPKLAKADARAWAALMGEVCAAAGSPGEPGRGLQGRHRSSPRPDDRPGLRGKSAGPGARVDVPQPARLAAAQCTPPGPARYAAGQGAYAPVLRRLRAQKAATCCIHTPSRSANPPGCGTAPICRARSSMFRITVCRASSPCSNCENSAVSKLKRPSVGANPGGVSGPVIVPVMRSLVAMPVPSSAR